jgi:primosomal protein N'
MIAQVVFDLPIEGPFDYLVPEELVSRVAPGMRVKVSFGARSKLGFTVGLLSQSTITKLKPLQALLDEAPVFSALDLEFAKDFSAYYGCSLGETLATMLRHQEDQKPSLRQERKGSVNLYRCEPQAYAAQIQQIMQGYGKEARFLVLVPDVFHAQTLQQALPGLKTGTRSSVFEADGKYACVVMVDDENASYKQEQTPMYETRQVLLRRAEMYGFDVSFIGISPSVELMALAAQRQAKVMEGPLTLPAVKIVDLTNYKYVPALISPPVKDALEAVIKRSGKSILVLNRRGSYRLTRCVDCGEALKCSHCDSPMIYSRAAKKFLCRHCTFTLAGDTVCPKCHKPSWRSQGIGVEQLQTELKKYFPQARIASFEREAKAPKTPQSLPDNFDILISTQAVLRFQGMKRQELCAFIDFDAELNRLDMRSAFHAFSLALHVTSMAQETVFIQTRNPGHYVLQSLVQGSPQKFYEEELKLRKEFGFSPFKHWIKITWRGKSEKTTREQAEHVYNVLSRSVPKEHQLTPPLADVIGRKRDQFRFNVMLQADVVPTAVAFIKSALAQTKRAGRVIVTLNIDP